MKRLSRLLRSLALVSLAVAQLVSVLLVTTWLHTTINLQIAKREGVYASPEDGMRVLVTESWLDVERVEIQYAGTNSFDGSNPHVWFVVARVWAASRGDGKPVHGRGYDSAGSYFLRVKDGWVHVREGRFPEFIGFGMRLFGIPCSKPALAG